MKNEISLALIVRDVEKTIDKCLSTFSQCVDEIIVVDTGSVDNTVETVKKYTDKVYFFEWVDDFATARNYSFEKCTKPYILWVDGDDYILQEDIQKINALDLSDKEIVICDYIYAHDEYGNPSMIVPRERIVKKSLGLKWQKRIHEYIPLLGKTYRSDIKTHHDKQHGTSERNLKILERIVVEEPGSREIYYLGKEYMDLGRIDDAIKYLNLFLTYTDMYWEDVYQAHHMLSLCHLNKGDEIKFKEHMYESMRIEECRAEPYYFLGLYYMNKQQYKKAIHWFEVCKDIKRSNDLLVSYQPEYYTWLPYLNLCVCYNAIGETDKAYEANKKALEYRPKDDAILNNDRILSEAVKRNKIKVYADGCGRKLHLGCGARRLEGYVNVDLFKGSAVDEVFDLDDIPYKDGTIDAIYSEHALEHVTFKRAENALKEWFRVLKPGGEVQLYMPDFENCCKAYLNAPLEDSFFMSTRCWFKMTVYGAQTSQAGEPDAAQIHQCGFSKEEIRIVVERNGFIVETVENYGGPGQKPDYGTPSMFIKAKKPGGFSGKKVGWISVENWDAAQTRIRVLRVDKWLKEHGYDSAIVNYADIINHNYDIAIVGKAFDEYNYNSIKDLKSKGKTVYLDLCEDIVGWTYVNEILNLCDKVICCSTALAEKVKSVNSNVVVIEDAWEN